MTGNLTRGRWIRSTTWCKNSSLSSKIIRSNQNITPNPNRLVAIACTNINNFYIFDLDVEVVDAVGNGVTTYGIYLNGCSNYSIVRCKIQAGKGSDGQPGTNGTNGINGANGVNGGNGCSDCGNTASRQRRRGGASSFAGSFGGGNGGNGGARSTSCPGSANGTGGAAGQGLGGAAVAAAYRDVTLFLSVVMATARPYKANRRHRCQWYRRSRWCSWRIHLWSRIFSARHWNERSKRPTWPRWRWRWRWRLAIGHAQYSFYR